jgi:phosphatidylglycerol:prolipoprotein diacylglycerol transferase
MAAVILGQPDRVAFTVFGLDIMWYAICIVVGMVCGSAVACARAPRYGINSDRYLDILLYALPSSIIGARAYYVLFEWGFYREHPDQILNIRAGGLAIHGGLIVAIAVAIFLVRRWKLDPFTVLDLAAPGIALGQAIGRWGNYFNQEAHGGHTDLPWAIIVDGDTVHPTFLYESIWCLLLCLFLLWLEKSGKKKFDGQLILLYVILYSAERFFVEGLRTDSLMIGPLRQAQVISLCCIVGALILWVPFKKRFDKKAAAAEAAPGTAVETEPETTEEEENK